jgi:hypothetical protein
MSYLQPYVRQLRPRTENYIPPVDKIQNFLTESSLGPKVLSQPAGQGPNSGQPRIEIFVDKIKRGEDHILTDGTTIIIKQITLRDKTYNKSNISQLIQDFEDNSKGIKISDPKISWEDLAKTPEYGGQGGGKKISTSTQELMTATIVLLGKKYDASEIDVKDAEQIIKAAEGKWNDVVGSKGKESLLKQFTSNWYDLATAISSANAILEIVPKPTSVFWTGQSWDDEIAPFNPPIGNIKDYNSSDIVVKGNNKYYGFSLKKKAASKDQDPTLINKPITGKKSLLKDFIPADDMAKIEKAKVLFFIRMLAAWPKFQKSKDKSGKEHGKTAYTLIRKMSDKEFGDWIRKIPNDFANDMLAGRGASGRRNIFWRVVNKILMKDSKVMMVAFMKLIFKVDLQPILDETNEFEFFLLTGIGKRKGDVIGVEPAEVKDLPSTIEALTAIFLQDNIKLGQTIDDKGKIKPLPWEYTGKKAPAKLFYTIYNGSKPLLNLELRYKGSKTAEPQFQATATPVFKNLMGGKK